MSSGLRERGCLGVMEEGSVDGPERLDEALKSARAIYKRDAPLKEA